MWTFCSVIGVAHFCQQTLSLDSIHSHRVVKEVYFQLTNITTLLTLLIVIKNSSTKDHHGAFYLVSLFIKFGVKLNLFHIKSFCTDKITEANYFGGDSYGIIWNCCLDLCDLDVREMRTIHHNVVVLLVDNLVPYHLISFWRTGCQIYIWLHVAWA